MMLDIGFSVLHLDFSPIKGPEGNIEYLIHIKKSEKAENLCEMTPDRIVELSHSMLKEV